MAGQGACEIGLQHVPAALKRHLPTVTRMVAPMIDPSSRSWLVGERGEQRAAREVQRTIRHIGAELVCDVPAGGENIDLVAVLPIGIFVVEVKHWSGKATLAGDVIFHGGPQPRRIHAQVERQRRKLRARLQLDVPINGVIVLVPNGSLRVTGRRAPDSTPVVMIDDLAAHLMRPQSAHRAVLSEREVAGIALRIRYGGPIPVRAADSEEPPAAPDPEASTARPCPRCEAPMVERTGPRGPFLGCSTFPRCRGTASIQ